MELAFFLSVVDMNGHSLSLYPPYRLLKKLIKAAAKSEGQSVDGIDNIAEESDSNQPLVQPQSSAPNSPLSASPTPSQDVNISVKKQPSREEVDTAVPKRITRIQSRGSAHSRESDQSENILRKRKFSRPGSVKEGKACLIMLAQCSFCLGNS